MDRCADAVRRADACSGNVNARELACAFRSADTIAAAVALVAVHPGMQARTNRSQDAQVGETKTTPVQR
jgi:hypothetical protein